MAPGDDLRPLECAVRKLFERLKQGLLLLNTREISKFTEFRNQMHNIVVYDGVFRKVLSLLSAVVFARLVI